METEEIVTPFTMMVSPALIITQPGAEMKVGLLSDETEASTWDVPPGARLHSPAI